MLKEKFPSWIRKRIDSRLDPLVKETDKLLRGLGLNTVCNSARCPNLNECYGKSTATFMILGNVCSRNCRFCSVENGIPSAPDETEPERIAIAAKKLKLGHVVITSVTRDDLPDKGAGAFIKTVKAIRAESPDTIIELLIPDLAGEDSLIGDVVASGPEIIGHNMETIARLYSSIKPSASYYRSLMVLDTIKKKDPGIFSKSSLMVGLGENDHDVEMVIRDLSEVHCDILMIGQYLRPSGSQREVERFVKEDEFEEYEKTAMRQGFKFVKAGTFVRSSYKASDFSDEFIRTGKKHQKPA